MKTFDIALKHLEGFDFKVFDIFSDNGYFDVASEVLLRQIKFEEEWEEKWSSPGRVSNFHYRGVVFSCAFYHLAFKAKGLKSCFDVACEICESKKDVLKTNFKTFAHTVYPQIMLDEWEKYCDSLNPKPEILKGEMMTKIFFAAYSYVFEADS